MRDEVWQNVVPVDEWLASAKDGQRRGCANRAAHASVHMKIDGTGWLERLLGNVRDVRHEKWRQTIVHMTDS